jgi:hypothetical protein
MLYIKSYIISVIMPQEESGLQMTNGQLLKFTKYIKAIYTPLLEKM